MHTQEIDLTPHPSVRETNETTSGAHLLLDTLLAHGVRVVFGLPGGTVMPLYDALGDRPSLEVVTCRHETAAMFAAMGHGRATGRPALVLVTSGPGLTNALTGLAAAACEGIPLLIVAGEISTASVGRFALQDGSQSGLDVLALTRPLTRFAARVDRATALEPLVRRALAEATGPLSGPVFLSLPIDVARAKVRAHSLRGATPTAAGTTDRGACEAAARLLAGADRPAIVLGNGARGRGVAAQVEDLAARTNAMVTATTHGKGTFPERHPRYLGVLGFGGHGRALEYLASADATLVVGSRLGDISTNGWTATLGGPLIQVDRDPTAIGRNHPTELGVVGDARTSLAAMRAALPARSMRPHPTGLVLDDDPRRTDDSVPIKPQWLMATLERALPRNTIFTVDIGEHAAFAVHHLRVDGPERFHMFAGLGSMGSGLCAAMGFKVAHPTTPVVAICGDGGLAMHAGELLTCAENGINVTFVVLNDGRYRMVDAGLEHIFGRRSPGLPAHVADLASLARACGAIGVTVDSPRDLDSRRLSALLSIQRPVVLDVRIDPSEHLSVQTRLASLKHFSEEGGR